MAKTSLWVRAGQGNEARAFARAQDILFEQVAVAIHHFDVAKTKSR